jgi:hypothetical protein
LNATSISKAVQKLAELTQDATIIDLEKPWVWREYDSEGVRFAFFRTYEELQELAVKLEYERLDQGPPVTPTQRILGKYHKAYFDLQAALLGVDEDTETKPSGEGEWPVRRVYSHIVGADVGFHVVVKYAIQRLRNGGDAPPEVSDEARASISGLNKEAFASLLEGSLRQLVQFHEDLHERVLNEFADISEKELEEQSMYWEGQGMSLRFRLHRFDSHMRQHTIQIDKTLLRIGYNPNEAKRLLRLLYAAVADCEGRLIGAREVGADLRDAVVDSIRQRVDEIAAILS